MSSVNFPHGSDEEEDLVAKALYVDGNSDEEVDDSRPPADGLEYLKRVRKEAKNCPQIVTADIPTARKPQKASYFDRVKAPAPIGSKPSTAWQRNQVTEFANVRLAVLRHLTQLNRKGDSSEQPKPQFPKKENEKGWCEFCLGSDFWLLLTAARSQDSEEGAVAPPIPEVEVPGTPPLMHIVNHLKPNIVDRLVEYHVTWADDLGGFTNIELQGPWLYALLARLEKPLHPDIQSTLRNLVLVCTRQRSVLPYPAPREDTLLPTLNLLICLVAKYFDQGDLIDTSEGEND